MALTEGTIMKAIAAVMKAIDDYDNGVTTRTMLAGVVTHEITAAVNGTYDMAFTMGVQADTEDDDDESIGYIPDL